MGTSALSALLQFLAGGKDPSHVEGLNAEFSSRLNSLLAAVPGGGVTINSGFRSNKRQAELYADAIKKYGSEGAARKWVAPPGKSNHNHGAAADLAYASPEAKQWVHDNAGRFGMGFRMDHEPWHIEVIDGQPTAVPDAGAAPTAMAGGPPGAPRPPMGFGERLFRGAGGGQAQPQGFASRLAPPAPALSGNASAQDPMQIASLLEQLQSATSTSKLFG